MNDSSRSRARTRPYPRYREFEKELRKAASAWFRGKGFAVSTSSINDLLCATFSGTKIRRTQI